MGCLGVALAALLAFAVPASIARTSLVGAYVVLVLLSVLLAAAVLANARRRRPDGAVVARTRVSSSLTWVVGLTIVYALAVAVIHRTG